MNKEISDIELIRRYYNGTLDKKAMHELEKRALDDPFLADAMDGFEHFDHQDNTFIELNERLKDRINKQYKSTAAPLNFKHWSLAASVIILIGLISIYLNMPKESNFSEEQVLTQKKVTPPAATHNKTLENEPAETEKMQTIIESREAVIAVTPKAKESALPTDIVVESVNQTASPAPADAPKAVSFNQTEITDNSSNLMARSAAPLALAEVSAIKDTAIFNKGKVTDIATGMPLLGVVVTDKKTGKSFLSNDKGEFAVPELATSLSFYIPGYEVKHLELKNNAELQNITLKTFIPIKEEVALNVPRRKTTAGPTDGWAAFKKYLNTNSELESGETGYVVVEFIIRSNAELSNFKILKSLSKLADARAIDLIKNYQSWTGSPAGAHKIKVTVKFN